MNHQQQLQSQVEQQARRMKKAEQDRPNLMGQTVFIGVLGMLFLLPVIGGAYLGLWLDDKAEGYSAFWTVSMIFAGVFIGIFNVYYFIKEDGHG